MRFFFVVSVLLLVLTGCSDKPGQPVQTTTFLISGPEDSAKREAIAVRSFEVTPETIKPGDAVTVKVELEKAAPSHPLAVDWHGPDGWVVSHELIDSAQTRTVRTAPVEELDEPGSYRVVLRSGAESFGEDTVTVTK